MNINEHRNAFNLNQMAIVRNHAVCSLLQSVSLASQSEERS